jgi:hypothetical protein
MGTQPGVLMVVALLRSFAGLGRATRADTGEGAFITGSVVSRSADRCALRKASSLFAMYGMGELCIGMGRNMASLPQ